MTDRPESLRPKSGDLAPDHFDDSKYLAFALVQAFRLFITLIAKRWPDIRGTR